MLAVDVDANAPPPYEGAISDPLASPSQSQTLNATRLARLRKAGRRAPDAEPADVLALDARAAELLKRCDLLLGGASAEPPAAPVADAPQPASPSYAAPDAIDATRRDAAAVVDLISEVVCGGFSPRKAPRSPPRSPRSPARTPPASPPRRPPPRVPPGEVEALRRRAAPHAGDDVVAALLARIEIVEGRLGSVDAAAVRRYEDRFVC